jgi:hypothetical protein
MDNDNDGRDLIYLTTGKDDDTQGTMERTDL